MDEFTRFDDLPIPEGLKRAIHRKEWEIPTKVQIASIPPALEGHDILATAETGSGKTGAFGIPLLARLYPEPGKQALIISPTRELSAQIHKVMRDLTDGLDFRGTLLVGGESMPRQLRELRAGVDYLVATPGRLIDHLHRGLRINNVKYLVLDEVDRMLDMGFAPQIEEILRSVPKDRQTLVFSATLPDEILKLAHRFLKNPMRIEARNATSSSPSQIVEETIETTIEDKPKLLLKLLADTPGRILIFTRTQSGAEHVNRILWKAGHHSLCLHAGRHQRERKHALDSFRKGTERVLVATDLASRGLDIEDIENVVNYDCPATHEDYVHRIGRTGRSGRAGKAVNFVTPLDFDSHRILSKQKPVGRVVFRSRARRGPSRR